MRAAGSALILAASVGLAFTLCRELGSHLQLLYELRELFVDLSCAARTSFQSMEILLGGLVKPKDERLCAICLEIAERLTRKEEGTGEQVWKTVFSEYGRRLALSVEEQEIVENAGKAFFGKSMEENDRHVSMLLARLDFQIEAARREQKEKQKVYGAVSVLGGLMLIIILI